MSLRKPPTRTPAFLAAHRLNAQKCTGPRTVAGKARSSLNALKHGQNADRLLNRLVAAGELGAAALYHSIWRQIESTFGIDSRDELKESERFTNSVYAMARQAGVFRTKLECPLFSARLRPRSMPLFRICVTDPVHRVGLVFWVQRKGFWNTERLAAAMFHSGTTSAEPPLGRALESGLRHRAYRMHRRGAWERAAYGLGESGQADPTQKPRPDLQRLLNKYAGRWGRDPAVERAKRPAHTHPASSTG